MKYCKGRQPNMTKLNRIRQTGQPIANQFTRNSQRLLLLDMILSRLRLNFSYLFFVDLAPLSLKQVLRQQMTVFIFLNKSVVFVYFLFIWLWSNVYDNNQYIKLTFSIPWSHPSPSHVKMTLNLSNRSSCSLHTWLGHFSRERATPVHIGCHGPIKPKGEDNDISK